MVKVKQRENSVFSKFPEVHEISSNVKFEIFCLFQDFQFNKHRAFNKAVGHGKKSQINKRRDYRVLQGNYCILSFKSQCRESLPNATFGSGKNLH